MLEETPDITKYFEDCLLIFNIHASLFLAREMINENKMTVADTEEVIAAPIRGNPVSIKPIFLIFVELANRKAAMIG